MWPAGALTMFSFVYIIIISCPTNSGGEYEKKMYAKHFICRDLKVELTPTQGSGSLGARSYIYITMQLSLLCRHERCCLSSFAAVVFLDEKSVCAGEERAKNLCDHFARVEKTA